jgi:N-carbamoylputrescine amidase
MKNLKVAAVTMESQPGEIEKNLRKVAYYAQEAVESGAEIICFPELCLSGYFTEKASQVYSFSRSEDMIENVQRLSLSLGIIILAGLVEMMPDGKPYLTHVIAGSEGRSVRYRKTHLSPPERERYRQGHEIPVYHQPGYTFGVQLCYEAHFPEISTTLALKGADIIFIPHASPWGTSDEKIQSWSRHLMSRAFDNALYVVACNQMGETPEGLSFPGVVLAINPAGKVMASYGGRKEKMLLVALSGEELKKMRDHRMRYFLPHRRPELYALQGSQGNQSSRLGDNEGKLKAPK